MCRRPSLGYKRRLSHASDHDRFPPDILGGIRVERRIEIYQVNALGRDAIAEMWALNKGVPVCPKGFSEAAKTRAEGLQIDLYSPVWV